MIEFLTGPWSLKLAEGLLWAQQQGDKAAKPQPTGPLPWWLPMVVLGVMLYLIMIRPERRKRSTHEMMLKNLKQNDRVVTIGGIYGTVVNASKDSESVVIRVDDNTRIRMLRSAIARVESEEKPAEKAEK